MTDHTTLSTGIYEGKYSVQAVVETSVGRLAKRFPLGTPLQKMKAWRNEARTRLDTLGRRSGGSSKKNNLRLDVKRYLKTLAMASKDSWITRRGELEGLGGRVRRPTAAPDHAR